MRHRNEARLTVRSLQAEIPTARPASLSEALLQVFAAFAVTGKTLCRVMAPSLLVGNLDLEFSKKPPAVRWPG